MHDGRTRSRLGSLRYETGAARLRPYISAVIRKPCEIQWGRDAPVAQNVFPRTGSKRDEGVAAPSLISFLPLKP